MLNLRPGVGSLHNVEALEKKPSDHFGKVLYTLKCIIHVKVSTFSLISANGEAGFLLLLQANEPSQLLSARMDSPIRSSGAAARRAGRRLASSVTCHVEKKSNPQVIGLMRAIINS